MHQPRAWASARARSSFETGGVSGVKGFSAARVYDELAMEHGEFCMCLDMPPFIGLALGSEKNAVPAHKQLVYGHSEALPEDHSCDVRQRPITHGRENKNRVIHG